MSCRAAREAIPDVNCGARFSSGSSFQPRSANAYVRISRSMAYEAFSAEPTALIKDFSSNGLLRNATAPAFSARSRALPSGNAVTKMTGVPYPFVSKCCCKSSPFNPGIFKSVITQAVFLT